MPEESYFDLLGKRAQILQKLEQNPDELQWGALVIELHKVRQQIERERNIILKNKLNPSPVTKDSAKKWKKMRTQVARVRSCAIARFSRLE